MSRRPSSPVAAGRAAAAGEGSARIERAVDEQQRQLNAAARALATADPSVVHHGRVAARRLRSMLKTFRPLFEPRRARLYRVDLRRFARALGAVREADVRRELVLALVSGEEALRPAERARLEALLDDLCVEARGSLRRHLAEPAWEALRRALQRHAVRGWLVVSPDVGLAQVLELADRSWKRPTRYLENPPDDAVELHELRLALKHCRYALQPLSGIAPEMTVRLMRRLRAAQDTLGEHRDVLLARHWVRLNERRLGRRLTERLAALLDQRERQLRTIAFRRIRRLRPALADWRKATRRLKGRTTARRA